MTVTTTGARRVELAQFLRSRRARLTPADVGMPPGLRRRTPGLRREEVAQLAGVGVTWYTWLEQGRPINASVQVLDAIARTLRLDRAEREHLYRLADVPSIPDRDSYEGADTPPELQTIIDSMFPLPAAIYNGRYDLLAWNGAYLALFPNLVRARSDERNVLWQVFTMPPCCCAIANRDEELPQLVAAFRAAFGRHVGEPAWTSFVRRLSTASPEFARTWANHDVAGSSSRLKFFRNVAGGVLRTISTNLAIPANPETRIAVYTPAGEEDRRLLDRITSGPPPTETQCPAHRSSLTTAG
jgi:transcriptional regulator with XRE-family HTH domain